MICICTLLALATTAFLRTEAYATESVPERIHPDSASTRFFASETPAASAAKFTEVLSLLDSSLLGSNAYHGTSSSSPRVTLVQTSNDEDKFDGAVWSFRIKPKDPNMRTYYGLYRISDHVMYQRDVPSDREFTKKIGTNHPKGTQTEAVFTDMRVFTKDKKATISRMRGTALLSMDEYGKWSGTFMDGRGRHWIFECKRVKE